MSTKLEITDAKNRFHHTLYIVALWIRQHMNTRYKMKHS